VYRALIEKLENCSLPERVDYMERKYENSSFRYRTVVCGLGSPGHFY